MGHFQVTIVVCCSSSVWSLWWQFGRRRRRRRKHSSGVSLGLRISPQTSNNKCKQKNTKMHKRTSTNICKNGQNRNHLCLWMFLCMIFNRSLLFVADIIVRTWPQLLVNTNRWFFFVLKWVSITGRLDKRLCVIEMTRVFGCLLVSRSFIYAEFSNIRNNKVHQRFLQKLRLENVSWRSTAINESLVWWMINSTWTRVFVWPVSTPQKNLPPFYLGLT